MDSEPAGKKIKYLFFVVLLVSFGLFVLFVALQSFKQKIVTQKKVDDTQKEALVSPETVVEPIRASKLNPEEVANIKYARLKASAERSGQIVKVAASNGTQTLDYAALNEYDEFMRTEGTTYVNAESIVIWFDNFPSSTVSLEERKKIAFDIMTDLRERIEAGEITMKQAGDIIKSNQSLRAVDAAWESNAYREILYAKKDQVTFFDPAIESLLWSMNPGTLSPVLTGRKIISEDNIPEAYYSLLKVEVHEEREYETYSEFLNAK